MIKETPAMLASIAAVANLVTTMTLNTSWSEI